MHAQGLERLEQLLRAVRRADSEMPAQTLHGLLFVAMHPGCSQKEMAEHLGVEASTVARIAARLSDWETYTRKGRGFLVNEVNPKNRRERRLFVTPKGQAFLNTLIEALG